MSDQIMDSVNLFDYEDIDVDSLPWARHEEREPFEDEGKFFFAVLLGLRAEGVSGVDNEGGKLHRVFRDLVQHRRDSINQILGFIPEEHPLFGRFRSVSEGLDQAASHYHIGFKNPTFREFEFKIDPISAREIISVLGFDTETVLSFAKDIKTRHPEILD